MEFKAPREISLPIRFLLIPERPDGLSSVACLNCQKLLDIHQPDVDLPDRMMATCPACRAWHLIDCNSNLGDVLIVLLPDLAPVHENLTTEIQTLS